MKKSLISRLRGKKLRDFVVYGKRKFFLEKVKKTHLKYGEEYYFSSSYLKRHCISSDLDIIVDNFIANHNVFFNNENGALSQAIKAFYKENQSQYLSIKRRLSEVMNHKYNLLGSGLKSLDRDSNNGDGYISYQSGKQYNEINWHLDFVAGYLWDRNSYYPESRKYTECPGADIKVPWELSRMQHLPILGIGHLIGENSDYSVEILNQITDWIDNNPLCKGPNWNCPMDVGIRVANWLVSLELISDCIGAHRQVIGKILQSVVQHIDYLWNNFEWSSKLTSNHYLSDIAGFLFAVVYMPSLKKEQEFKRFLVQEFEQEIIKQMYNDGMNAEGSLSYHRLVFELFAYSHRLATRNSLQMSSIFEAQLKRSFDFTMSIVGEDGRIPQIGDNDGGIFLQFSPKELTDFSYLSALLNDQNKSTVSEQKLQLEHVLFAIQANDKKSQSCNSMYLYKESGLAVVKSGERRLYFYNGSNGQKGNGGHCHNDRLSFCLFDRNQEIFADPGTGVYTSNPHIRDRFRSTYFHNTVVVEGQEQNRFLSNGYLFSCVQDITEQELETQETDTHFSLHGSHNGYHRINGTVHSRTITGDKNLCGFEVVDSLNNKSSCEAIYVIRKHDGIEIGNGVFKSDLISIEFTGATGFNIDEIDYSPSYGYFIENGCYRLKVSFSDKLITRILLRD